VRRSVSFSILGLFLLPLLPAAAAQDPGPRLKLAACADPALPEDARCGIYQVFENRAAKKGRKIPLRVVVLPALGPDRLPDPVVFFAGGPGQSAVETGLGWVQGVASLRQRRDLLLVDLRGTGGPGFLGCPEVQDLRDGIQELVDGFIPAGKLRACRERLEKTHDLTQYTSDNAIDDVDEVRAALGYPRVNVMGGSYGTRSVLVYLRRHPDRVRTAVLDRAVPTYARGPLFFARTTQKAQDGLVAECAADPACAQAFPRLGEEIGAVLAQAGREPVRVQLTDVKTGKPYEVRLSRIGVAQILRFMLYSPAQAAEIPLRVHRAAEGDWKPLAEMAGPMVQSMVELYNGYGFGVLCSEDVPFIREEEIPAAVAGTSVGDFRVRKQQATCAGWKAAKIPRSFLEPVASDVPSLILAGELDPAAPPADGEEIGRGLRHSKYVLIPGAGHSNNGFKGRECVEGLIAKLVEEGSADRLDGSCVARMERPAFALSFGEPEVTVARADLEAMAGRYAGEGFPPVKIDLVEGRLRLEIESEAYLLVPTAANRFRPEGMPAGYAAVFERTGGGPATALIIEKPGEPGKRLEKRP
jgi:pimeloyl-ACP methyl ester carboxylesterase